MSAADKFAAAGSGVAGAQPGAMFGKPCFKLDGKAFVCLFQDCMVFKLEGAAHAQAVAMAGSKLFDPSGSGRAMREWVQVSLRHSARWGELAAMAAAYLRSGGATKAAPSTAGATKASPDKPPAAKAASAKPAAKAAKATTTAVRTRASAPRAKPSKASKPATKGGAPSGTKPKKR
jgi:hypothetical protein